MGSCYIIAWLIGWNLSSHQHSISHMQWWNFLKWSWIPDFVFKKMTFWNLHAGLGTHHLVLYGGNLRLSTMLSRFMIDSWKTFITARETSIQGICHWIDGKWCATDTGGFHFENLKMWFSKRPFSFFPNSLLAVWGQVMEIYVSVYFKCWAASLRKWRNTHKIWQKYMNFQN